jgi:hypothetical protein
MATPGLLSIEELGERIHALVTVKYPFRVGMIVGMIQEIGQVELNVCIDNHERILDLAKQCNDVLEIQEQEATRVFRAARASASNGNTNANNHNNTTNGSEPVNDNNDNTNAAGNGPNNNNNNNNNNSSGRGSNVIDAARGRGNARGFGDRGRAGARGGAAQAAAAQAVRNAPGLAPAPADPNVTRPAFIVPRQLAQQVAQEQAFQASRDDWAQRVAATELAVLTTMEIPAKVAVAAGCDTRTLPLLPKKDAARYSVPTFITRAKYDVDTPEGLLAAEEPFRARALRGARQVLMVRGAGRPYLFLYDVAAQDRLTPLRSRIVEIDLTTQCVTIEGWEERPSFVLQGTEASLFRFAEGVQLKHMIGKSSSGVAFWEATGIPKEGWQAELLGAPEDEIAKWKFAPRRMVARSKYDPKDGFEAKFSRAGHWRTELTNHVRYVYMNGFDLRFHTVDVITTDLKALLLDSAKEWAKSMFADEKAKPSPPQVADVPPLARLEIAARNVEPTETALYALSSNVVPEESWAKLAAHFSMKVLMTTPTGAVFATSGGGPDHLEGVRVGSCTLSRTYHG